MSIKKTISEIILSGIPLIVIGWLLLCTTEDYFTGPITIIVGLIFGYDYTKNRDTSEKRLKEETP